MALTLLNMANSICATVGQYDATSLNLCKGYLTKGYSFVWDSYFWRDSEMLVQHLVTAGTNNFGLPFGMERIVTIGSAGGLFLDPVDESFILEAAPDTLTGSGFPKYYTEKGTVTVYPTPSQDVTFYIFGKKVFPGFSGDSDTSVLRNCDSAIMAFAHSDMLQRGRNYPKAKDKYQEAQGLLETAKSVEVNQSNRPRRNKNLTVAGNSLAEMTDAVCGICGQWTPDIRLLVQEFLRRNYVTLYQSMLWPESTVVVRVGYTGEQIVLPDFVDRVVGARTNDGQKIMPNDVGYLFSVAPSIFEQTGTALSMSILTPVGVSMLPLAPPEQLVISSSASTDNGKRVFVRGEASGSEVTEEVVLGVSTGTVYAYDVPLTVAKPITDGDVSIGGATSLQQYELLPAGVRERKHQRLWLLPLPASTDPVSCESGVLILGKRHIIPLRTEEDTPIITGAQGTLIASAAADLYSRLGNADLAQKYTSRADLAMKALTSENMDQGAYSPKVVPSIEPYMYQSDDIGYCWSKQ